MAKDRRLRRVIKVLCVFLALGVLVASLLWQTLGPVIRQSTYRSIPRFASQDDVRQILGDPMRSYASPDGRLVWHYKTWLNPGWVEVWFDQQGRFDSVNDESAFGPM